jgi:muramoyltetrapeptide carboxypeptidase LdcA involved in peptidoglycan recycling
MKELVNRYFKGVVEMLDKKGIKWSNPQATITLEECPLPGIYRTKMQALKEIFEDQREKMIFTPIGTFLAIFIARYLSIMDTIDAAKDAKKAVTSTLEALIVVILLIGCQVLLVSRKRAFTFKI